MEFVNESNKNETPNTDFLELIDGDDKNQYYLLEKGKTIYRADDKKNKLNEYKPRFFGYKKEDVKSYGAIVYKFQVNTTLKLLALDKNITSFYNEAPEHIKEILRNQYGYNSESKKPIRDSFSPNDNKLLDYLCSTKKYDGYATDLMKKVDNFDGLFPREIVICDSEKYNAPVIISEITDEQKERLQQDANLLEYTKREKMSRKKNRHFLSSNHEVGKFSLGDDDDENDENNPNNVNPSRKLFGGKRKSKRKSVKKKRVIKNRKNKRTIKKNNKNKKIKNSKNIVRNRK